MESIEITLTHIPSESVLDDGLWAMRSCSGITVNHFEDGFSRLSTAYVAGSSPRKSEILRNERQSFGGHFE